MTSPESGADRVIAESANTLREAFPSIPRIAITLGSGHGGFVDVLTDAVSVPFEELPPLPRTGVVGHGGRFVYGRLDDQAIHV